MDPSPTLKQFLMLKPKNKGEREKAEEGGQWGDVTGSRDPSFRRPPQPGCPAFIIVKLSPLRDRLVVRIKRVATWKVLENSVWNMGEGCMCARILYPPPPALLKVNAWFIILTLINLKK